MKIGSFFLILLAALVALGYLLSDSFHLREDMTTLQREVERLSVALQSAEKEKEDTLLALQTANQDLQSCRQTVEQSNQVIARLTDENGYLREQNRVLVSQQSLPVLDQTPIAHSTAYGLIALVVLGIGSLTVVGLKSLPARREGKQNVQGNGHYVFLSEAEIVELIQRRRKA